MNEFVLGKKVQLMVKIGNAYLPYACADSVEIATQRELIPCTTATSGTARKFRYRYAEWTAKIGGLTYIQNTEIDSISVFDALTAQSQLSGHDISILFEDEQGRTRAFNGSALIPDVSLSASAEDFCDFEVEYQGNGMWEMTNFTTPPNSSEVFPPITFTSTAGGEMELTNPALIGRVLLHFTRSGSSYQIITTGAPNGNQVKFDASTGKLSWTAALAAGEWLDILYK